MKNLPTLARGVRCCILKSVVHLKTSIPGLGPCGEASATSVHTDNCLAAQFQTPAFRTVIYWLFPGRDGTVDC